MLAAELINRRIILFVVVMVLFLPAFDINMGVWGRYIGVDRGGLRMLHEMAALDPQAGQDQPAFTAALQVGCWLVRRGTYYLSRL